jgi:hypothetical protein
VIRRAPRSYCLFYEQTTSRGYSFVTSARRRCMRRSLRSAAALSASGCCSAHSDSSSWSGLAAAHTRAEPGDPRAARTHPHLLAPSLKAALGSTPCSARERTLRSTGRSLSLPGKRQPRPSRLPDALVGEVSQLPLKRTRFVHIGGRDPREGARPPHLGRLLRGRLSAAPLAWRAGAHGPGWLSLRSPRRTHDASWIRSPLLAADLPAFPGRGSRSPPRHGG